MNRPFKPYPFTAKQYPASLPPLDGGVDQARHPVVVVGGGPVGYCAALGLASHGVPVVLLEADDSVCFGSRAICISRRSLEIIARLGAAEGFLKQGLPWTGGRSFYRDDEVLHFKMPMDENQKHPPMINLAQYSIEQLLLDAAEQRRDLVEVRWQNRVTAIDAREDGTRLSIETPAGAYTMEADWVVAADGGRSFLRETLGLKLKGTSYEGRYVIVDIVLDSARPAERLAYFDPPCNPGSTVLVHKQPSGVWRVDYQLRDGEDPDEAIKPENVMPRVESLLGMMGETGAWSPVWIGIYKANALTLDDYRHRRVLFAGDAAHLLPIFGVRGANSGIDDADNLAWKLAFVVKGLASPRLLDSYSAERVVAARENLSYGTKSTEFMAPPSFAFELMRKAVLGLAVKFPELRSLINPRQSSAIAYTHSPLNVAAQETEFRAGPGPGQVLPECPLGIIESGLTRNGHLTDLIGPVITALYFSDDGVVPEELSKLDTAMRAGGVPFAVVPLANRAGATAARGWDESGQMYPMYDAAPAALYLVRPDGHVIGRWRRFDAATVTEAIDHLLQP
ncbi:FAD-dependent oxidoreductase [Afipia sp. GAS231]|uniref:FAD-dependent oxidoreductase n=1 Tax=Afipia sp. GAS231 TaxID=1882747 RepID=UPI00087B5DBF|nr:FAD-dependent oxidoreductase [Afipia sp. GAS231]SDO43046.1 3-(3-hydroxy-phenyl)propionate hydroxylase [Afipia sp. GAS231]